MRARERIRIRLFFRGSGAIRESRIANLVTAVTPYFFSVLKNPSEESRGNA